MAREFHFSDRSFATFIEDVESPKKTLVFTKTIEGREINHAVDFPGDFELSAFLTWLSANED